MTDRVRHGMSGGHRFWVLAFLAAVAVLSLGLVVENAGALPSCTDNFNGNVSNDWGNASNWSAGLPGQASVVCWTTQTPIVEESGDIADSIQGGALEITTGTLTLSNNAGADSNLSTITSLSMAGSGALYGPGQLDVSGTFSWGAGTIGGSGSEAITIDQQVSSCIPIVVGTNPGSFSILGSSASFGGGSISSNCSLLLGNTGFSGSNDPSLTTTGSIVFGAPTFTGAGPIAMSAAGFEVSTATTLANYDLTLTGNTSSFAAAGDSLSAPLLVTDSGTTLTVPSGDGVSAGAGTVSGTITGAGTFTSTGSTTIDGTLSSNVSVTGGTLDVASGATYSAGAGTGTSVTSGTLELYPATATTGNFTVTGGEVDGEGADTLTVTGNYDQQAGDIEGLTIDQTGSGTFAIDGSGAPGGQPDLGDSAVTTHTTGTVTLSNTGFNNTDSTPSSITSTTTPITIDPGNYNAAYDYAGGYTLSAPGFNLSGGSADLDYGRLVVTGSHDSNLASTLTAQLLSVNSGDEINLGGAADGITVTGENGTTGTIDGTVDGSGTFTNAGASTTVGSGGSLSASHVALSGGTLDLASGSTYSVGTGTSVTNGTLELYPATATTGNFTVTGGEVDGEGADTLTVTGNYDQQAGDIEGLTIDQTGSGTFAIDGSGAPGGQPDLGDSAVTTHTTGTVTLSNTGFNNTDSTPSSITSTTTPITIDPGNYNAAYDYAGGYTLSAPGFNLSGGSADLDYGRLVVTGSHDSNLASTLTTQLLSVNSGDEINLGGAADGITVTGENGTTGTIDGTVDGSGTFTLNGALIDVTAPGFDPGALDVSNGTLDIQTPNASAGSADLSAGMVEFGAAPDTLTVNGNYTQTGGTLQGPGTLDVTGSGDFDLQTGPIDHMTVGQSGTGTFAIDGAGTPFLGASTVLTSTTGTVTLSNTRFNSEDNVASTITSTATPITIDPGDYNAAFDYNTGYTLTAPGFEISGTTTLASGSLVQTGGTSDIATGQTLAPVSFTLQGGTLDGAGTIGGNVSNTAGIVAPGDAPGILTVTGNYVQDASGTLQIADDGPGTAGTNFSQLDVQGSATLAGTLAIVPSAPGYVSAASPSDPAAEVLSAGSTPSGTFASVTSTPALHDGDTFSALYTDPNQVDVIVNAGAPLANTSLPTIGGSPVQGDQLTLTSPGQWSPAQSSFTYQWEDCTALAGRSHVAEVDSSCTPLVNATGTTYTLTSTDVGKYVTIVVTPQGSSTGASAVPVGPVTPPPPTPKPVEQTPPSVQGSPLPGNTLTCNPGTWSGSPTFAYSWQVNSTTIGDTSKTLLVTILDEGQTITCTVTASNSGGAATPETSGATVVAVKGTLTCPKPSGAFSGKRIGRLALGEARAAARKSLTRFAVTHYGFDDFCLYGGWGIRAGYSTNRIALLLTANPFYKLDGITPGLAIASIEKRLHVGKEFVIGLNDWYVAPGTTSNYVFKVRHGIIQEIGIANKADTSTPAKQKAFLSGFKAV